MRSDAFWDVLQRFAVNSEANRPSAALSSMVFRKYGFDYVPPSYDLTMVYFGENRVCSDNDRFWICVPEHSQRYYSIDKLAQAFRDKCNWWKETFGNDWRLIPNQQLSAQAPNIQCVNLLPLFCNTEYDHWLCFNKDVLNANQEPEVLHFDFGNQKLINKHNGLAELLDAVSRGSFCEDILRDDKGRIMMESFPR